MNAKHYNNVIDWTLKHDRAAQTEDSLATARAIFNNMGVALPNGSMPEVYETIKTNQYMGWEACTMEKAQQVANNGTAAIGISRDRIVVLAATDAEEPIAETATVMTLSESTSAYSVAGLEYYTYYYNTNTSCNNTTTCYPNDYIQCVLNKIQACSSTIIPTDKKNICVAISRCMLSNGYKIAFVAGLLANIVFEGSVGMFESSNYGTNPKPDYLTYMDTIYNGKDFYLNNYSGKTIMDVDVQAVWNMLNELKTLSNNTWEIGNSRVGFGLGCIQWTFGRTYSLACLYKEQAMGSTSISTAQAISAEVAMIMNELQSENYNWIVTSWKNNCASNINSAAAANLSASMLCFNYLIPHNISEQASKRALRAEAIYSAMIT